MSSQDIMDYIRYFQTKQAENPKYITYETIARVDGNVLGCLFIAHSILKLAEAIEQVIKDSK